MLFNSIHFLVFFPIVVGIFFLIPHRFRWMLLLAASYYFYMSYEVVYGLLLLGTTLVDYTVGRLMDSRWRRWNPFFLGASLLANLGILFTFKYWNFFFESVWPLAEYAFPDMESPVMSLLLPVGLSFYVFQSLSYTIDVYRGKRKAERHFGIFALYVSFFPQLVAGPIETSTHLLPQFYKKMAPERERFFSGLRLMLWGFFKKIVIADNAAILVNAVYGDVGGVNGIALGVATFFFAIQIYADFSGYSDIARGSARIMGYDLSINFVRPYFSRSVAEFWRRWHISLMHWFREYIFFPLGGSRVTMLLWVRNILTVFLISGLWHGARWTFVVWGLLNAFYIIVSRLTEDVRKDLAASFSLARFPLVHHVFQIVVTFALTMLAWIFFRSETMEKAFSVCAEILQAVRQVVHDPSVFTTLVSEASGSFGVNAGQMKVLLCATALLILIEGLLESRVRLLRLFFRLPRVVRWFVYYSFGMTVLFAGNLETNAFIYFQF